MKARQLKLWVEPKRKGCSMAQQQTSQTPSHFGSLVFNYVLFTFLGLACSFLWQSYYNTDNDNIGQHLHLFSTQTQEYALKEVRTILQGTDCEDVKEEAKCPDNLKTFMGTKLRYQFEPIVKNESSVGHCHVAKVCNNRNSYDPQFMKNYPYTVAVYLEFMNKFKVKS